ncbi:MAG: copper resistance protein CopC/CopD [Streptosporangiaceae bacterium]|nr:copper resistance protein CopC/CopD [Streptosporangiaceae bacterium]
MASILVMLATMLAGLGLLGLTSAPASAVPVHATLLTTSPADGSIVATAPEDVVLSFDDVVTVSPDSIEVFSPTGHQVQDPPATTGTSDSVAEVGLRSGLGRGTYTVSWQVVSDDSHPVSGTFAFSVGAPSRSLMPAGVGLIYRSPAVIGVAFGVARWLGFVAFAVLIGGVAFILIGWPAGTRDPVANRLLTASVVALAGATLAELALQGPYTATNGKSLFSLGMLRAVLVSRFGHALELRLILLAAVTIAIAYVWPSLDGHTRTGTAAAPAVRPGAVLAWAVSSAGLAATWSTADHAAVGAEIGLSIAADIAHLVSMAAWTGGLMMLSGVLLRQRSVRAHAEHTWSRTAVTAVRRFSALAMIAVIVLVISGVYEAWRNVGGYGTLVHTSYGHILLFKSAGLALLVFLGYLARTRIRRLTPMPEASRRVPVQPARVRVLADGSLGAAESREEPPGVRAPASNVTILRRLRISVLAEIAIVLIVLALSAVLVEMPTGREAAHSISRQATSGAPDFGRLTHVRQELK